MGEQELVIKISAKNLTSDEFAKARKEIAGLTEQTEKGKKATKDGELSWASFGKTVGGVATTVASAVSIVGGAIGAVAAAVLALGKRGADVQDIRDQFGTLNEAIGNDSKKAIDTLSTAVDGVVSKFDLMQATNKALSAGMKATNEDFRTMGEGARVLADRVGTDTKEAYTALMDALATGRTARLAQIGLNIDETQAWENHAKALGVDVNQLNEHGKRVAVQTALMAELKDVVDTSGRAQMDFADSLDASIVKLSDWYDDLSVAISSSKVLGEALKAGGEVLQTAFGDRNQDLIKQIVHWIELAAITTVEWGRTAVTAGDIMQRIFNGERVIFDAVGLAVARLGQYFFKLVEGLAFVGSKIPMVGDQFAGAKQEAHDLAQWLGGVADGFAQAGGEALQTAIGTRDSNDMFTRLDRTLANVRNRMVDAMAATDDANEATKRATGSTREHAQATGELSKEIQKLQKDNLKGLIEGFNSLVDAQGRVIKMSKEQAEAWLKNRAAEVDASKNAADLIAKRTLGEFDYQIFIIKREEEEKKKSLDRTAANYSDALTAIEQETAEKMAAARKAHNDEVEQMKNEADSWGNRFRDIVGSIPGLLQSAFTGGGGLSGFFNSFLSKAGEGLLGKGASGLLGGLFNKVVPGLSNMLGMGFTQALGMAIPGIGNAIGALAGPLLGKLGGFVKGIFGGPSAKEMEGRDASAQVRAQLRDMLTDQQRLEAGGEAWKEEIIAVRDAYLATGHTEAEALSVVDRLHKAEKQGAEAVKKVYEEINGVLNDQQRDQQDLQAAIQKYGFTIDELGPTMRKQQLTEQAMGLANEFRLLVGSGINIDTVIKRMGASLNEYLQTAIRTGTEVPKEMEPIVRKMIETGQLTDANGNKIESLEGSGITFAETMTQGFDRVVGALNRLLEGLGLVKKEAESLPNVDRTITYHKRADGDVPTEDTEPEASFATEAYVRRPTLAVVGDVPGGEFVLKPSTVMKWMDAAAQAGAQAGGGGRTVVVNVNAVAANAEQIRTLVYREIGPKLLDYFTANKDGSLTDLKNIVGVGA